MSITICVTYSYFFILKRSSISMTQSNVPTVTVHLFSMSFISLGDHYTLETIVIERESHLSTHSKSNNIALYKSVFSSLTHQLFLYIEWYRNHSFISFPFYSLMQFLDEYTKVHFSSNLRSRIIIYNYISMKMNNWIVLFERNPSKQLVYILFDRINPTIGILFGILKYIFLCWLYIKNNNNNIYTVPFNSIINLLCPLIPNLIIRERGISPRTSIVDGSI